MYNNHPNDRFIKITAKYDGNCANGCNHRIQAGETITYDRATKQAAHFVCPQLAQSIERIQAR